MQMWLSSEAFLDYHYACFRSLSISRVSSLSGGGLTVTINTLSWKLQDCMRQKPFKVLFHSPLFFVQYKARQHSHMTCSAVEYWIINRVELFMDEAVKASKGRDCSGLIPQPPTHPPLLIPETEMKGCGDIKS